MKNDYVIIDEKTAIILVEQKNGARHEVIVDLEDLDRIDKEFSSVNVSFYKNTGSYYAKGKKGKKSIYIHRFVTDAPSGMVVDHINHKKLDNRKSQLEVKTNRDNSFNRKGKNKNNKSGWLRIRMVGNKFIARVHVGGKEKRKTCASLEEAQQTLKEWGY